MTTTTDWQEEHRAEIVRRLREFDEPMHGELTDDEVLDLWDGSLRRAGIEAGIAMEELGEVLWREFGSPPVRWYKRLQERWPWLPDLY